MKLEQETQKQPWNPFPFMSTSLFSLKMLSLHSEIDNTISVSMALIVSIFQRFWTLNAKIKFFDPSI